MKTNKKMSGHQYHINFNKHKKRKTTARHIKEQTEQQEQFIIIQNTSEGAHDNTENKQKETSRAPSTLDIE